jgi:hypothetical protein
VAGDMAEPPEDFETWLRRRVAQAVEAGRAVPSRVGPQSRVGTSAE